MLTDDREVNDQLEFTNLYAALLFSRQIQKNVMKHVCTLRKADIQIQFAKQRLFYCSNLWYVVETSRKADIQI